MSKQVCVTRLWNNFQTQKIRKPNNLILFGSKQVKGPKQDILKKVSYCGGDVP